MCRQTSKKGSFPKSGFCDLFIFDEQDFVIYVDPPSHINMLMYFDSIGL